MSQTVLVTGATGLAGANICKLLVERGDTVRALARQSADTGPLGDLGVEVVTGDVTDPDAVLRAATGSDAAIHCAALLGGASQDMADFEAVNIGGTKNVLDAAEKVDLRRVVAVSTGTFFDTTTGLDREDAPVTKNPSQDPYTVTKMAAFLDAMARAAESSTRLKLVMPSALLATGEGPKIAPGWVLTTSRPLAARAIASRMAAIFVTV